MSGVQTITVKPGEADMRLDRWFRQHFPALGHGRLEKLLRTGQVRVDGKRAKSGQRLAAGQAVRVPPLGDAGAAKAPARAKAAPEVTPSQAEDLRARVLHRDEAVLVIDKPAGLAVQGGSGTAHHLDAMLDALRFDAEERPRLVHRLDKDTSGVLVLARTRQAAAALTRLFRTKEVRKLYWAAVVGVPKGEQGRLAAGLIKLPGAKGDKMVVDDEVGKSAVTVFRMLDHLGRKAAWLALEPRTGRTHQLRVHCAHMGLPIIGDGKYGGAEAFSLGGDVGKGVHLHARAVRFAHPGSGRLLEVRAPLPPHMRATWSFLGFDPDLGDADTFDILATI